MLKKMSAELIDKVKVYVVNSEIQNSVTYDGVFNQSKGIPAFWVS